MCRRWAGGVGWLSLGPSRVVGAGSCRSGFGFAMWLLVMLFGRLRAGMVWLWVVGGGDGNLMLLEIVVRIFVLCRVMGCLFEESGRGVGCLTSEFFRDWEGM